MATDETEAGTDMGELVSHLWINLPDCNKSGKDVLKTKIKEHKKKQKHKQEKQRTKERRREKEQPKLSKRSKGRCG